VDTGFSEKEIRKKIADQTTIGPDQQCAFGCCLASLYGARMAGRRRLRSGNRGVI